MLYRAIRDYLLNSPEEYDTLARITQHPLRPKPERTIDQIFMLPGSQLNQTKLMSPYLRDKHVVFVGDGDAMALSIGLLAEKDVIQGPQSMLVLDFDKRLVKFVNDTAKQFNIHDRVEARFYNVLDPVPADLRGRYDVFYTNPPYGSKNRGKSGIGFLVRCMALCTANSLGIAILPYQTNSWSGSAMHDIQGFMRDHGYTVGDMLRGMHSYHLDDLPMLRSATVIFDRTEAKEVPYLDDVLPTSLTQYFYGSDNMPIPSAIGEDGALETS